MAVDEAADLLEAAGHLLDKAIPAYIAIVHTNGTETEVVAAVDDGEGFEIIYELMDVVVGQGTPANDANDPLFDALYAVANERLTAVVATLRGAA